MNKETQDQLDKMQLAFNEMTKSQEDLRNVVAQLMDKMMETHLQVRDILKKESEFKIAIKDLDKNDAEYQAENSALESEMDK